jgi:hypothetical protein
MKCWEKELAKNFPRVWKLLKILCDAEMCSTKEHWPTSMKIPGTCSLSTQLCSFEAFQPWVCLTGESWILLMSSSGWSTSKNWGKFTEAFRNVYLALLIVTAEEDERTSVRLVVYDITKSLYWPLRLVDLIFPWEWRQSPGGEGWENPCGRYQNYTTCLSLEDNPEGSLLPGHDELGPRWPVMCTSSQLVMKNKHQLILKRLWKPEVLGKW